MKAIQPAANSERLKTSEAVLRRPSEITEHRTKKKKIIVPQRLMSSIAFSDNVSMIHLISTEEIPSSNFLAN